MKPLICRKCGETDPEKFYPSMRDRGRTLCKVHHLELTRPAAARWQHENRDYVRAYQETYRDLHRDKVREWNRNAERKKRAKRQQDIALGLIVIKPRPTKPYLCKVCGTDDPKRFTSHQKSRCNACYTRLYRQRQSLAPWCRICGDDDPANFYPSMPLACKLCHDFRSKESRRLARPRPDRPSAADSA